MLINWTLRLCISRWKWFYHEDEDDKDDNDNDDDDDDDELKLRKIYIYIYRGGINVDYDSKHWTGMCFSKSNNGKYNIRVIIIIIIMMEDK